MAVSWHSYKKADGLEGFNIVMILGSCSTQEVILKTVVQ